MHFLGTTISTLPGRAFSNFNYLSPKKGQNRGSTVEDEFETEDLLE